MPVPGKALLQHHHALEGALPLAHEQRAGLGAPKFWQRDDGPVPSLSREAVQHADRLAIEITCRIGLDAVGQRSKQEGTGQLGRGAPEHHAPAAAQAHRIHRGKPVEFSRKA